MSVRARAIPAVWRFGPDARWLAGWAAALLVLTALPGLAAAWLGPRDLVPSGTFRNVYDFQIYLSAMREAAQTGAWLVHHHASAEPTRPALIHVPYVLVGRVAGWLDADLMSVYRGFELIGRLALIGALALFARQALGPERWRPGFLLACFATGLGFWRAGVQALLGEEITVGDGLYYGSDTANLLLSGLHLQLGLALYLTGALAFLRAVERPSPGRLTALALSMAGLSLANVHATFPLGGAMLLAAGLRAIRERRFPRAEALAGLVAALAMAPVVVHALLVFVLDPIWSGVARLQNVVPSPPLYELPVHFGVVLPLAALAVARHWGSAGPSWRFAALLALSGLLWMYAPLSYQYRFAFGLPQVLGVLAVPGWDWLGARLAPGQRRLGNLLLPPVAATTTVAAYLGVLVSTVLGGPYPVYTGTADDLAAARWLAPRMAADDVLVSELQTGYFLVGELPGRLALAHTHMTHRYEEKRALVERLYAADTPDDERRALLDRLGARYVYHGPREREILGGWDPASADWLELVYSGGSVRIYRLRGADRAET